MKPLLVFGAGGHARVVIDIAAAMNREVLGLVDDDIAKKSTLLLGLEILGNQDEVMSDQALIRDSELVIALGSGEARERLHREFGGANWRFTTLVHPSAILGLNVEIGIGSVVMAQAVVNVNTRVGIGAVINTSASIDHDNVIGDYAQIAPGAVLCGEVSVGKLAFVGAGATVLPGVNIGERAMIGAGAVVVHDVPSDTCVVGVPAKPIR